MVNIPRITPISSHIRPLKLDFSGFANAGAAFLQGQQVALARKKQQFAEKAFEAEQKAEQDAIARAQAEKEAKEMEFKSGIADRLRVQEMNRVRRAMGQGASGEVLEKVYDTAQGRYQQTTKKLGLPVEKQFSFPEMGEFAGPTQPGEDRLLDPGQLVDTARSEQRRLSTQDPAVLSKYGKLESEAATLMDAENPGEGFRDPWVAAQDPRWREYVKKAQEGIVARAPRGADIDINNINQGPADLAKKTRGDLEGSVIGALQTSQALNAALAQAVPEHFTIGGRLNTGLLEAIDYASPDLLPEGGAETLTAKTQVAKELKQMFNAYRKSITGAAAGEKELRDLEASFPNVKQSWTVFRASAMQLRNKMRREIRLSNYLLNPLTGAAPEGANIQLQAAELLSRQGEDWDSPQHAKWRAEQLRQTNVPENRIKQILLNEGYRVGRNTPGASVVSQPPAGPERQVVVPSAEEVVKMPQADVDALIDEMSPEDLQDFLERTKSGNL